MSDEEKGVSRQPTEAELGPVTEEEAPALSRDAILDANDAGVERVPCPEWGGAVYVRVLRGDERDAFENLCAAQRQGDTIDVRGLKAQLAVMCACDADGVPLFKPNDAAALNKKAARPIDRVFKVAQRLNGLTDQDVEELVKNSEGDRSGDSGSG